MTAPGYTNALVQSAQGAGFGYGQEGARLAFRFNDVALVVVNLFAGFHARALQELLVSAWPLVIYVSLGTMSVLASPRRETSILLTASFGAVALMALGQWHGQVLLPRYFVAVAAPIYLLAARLLARVPRRVAPLLLGSLVVLALLAWADQTYEPGNVLRFDNRAAFAAVERGAREGDLVLFAPDYLEPLVTYYLDPGIDAYGMPLYGEGGRPRNSDVEIDEDLERLVGESPRVWLVLSFQDIRQVRNDSYAVRYWLRHEGYRLRSHRRLNQVEVLEFERPEALGPPGVTR
jgi:hypothetical protein